MCVCVCVIDCPQVQAVTRFEATQPDELLLEESDVVNVSRKVSDDGKSQSLHHKFVDVLFERKSHQLL